MVKVSPRDGAPHLFIDTVITAGSLGGNIQINFGAFETRRIDGGAPDKSLVSVAHMRMSPLVAKELAAVLLQCVESVENDMASSVPVAAMRN
jgi:hypothetical protein